MCWCGLTAGTCSRSVDRQALRRVLGISGGKLEAGESVEAALARELHEELGIAVTECHRWHTLEHDYPHAYVRLYFCKVTGWTGEPHSREGQAFVWQHLPVDVAPLLPAALPVLELLAREQGDAQQ